MLGQAFSEGACSPWISAKEPGLSDDDFIVQLPALRSAPTSPLSRLNPAESYLVGLGSDSSRITNRSYLNKIAGYLGLDHYRQIPWHELERHHVLAILQKLKNSGKAPSTIKSYLSLIKGVAREAWAQQRISTDTYAHIKDIRPPRGSRLPKGRALSAGEVQKLLQTCCADTRCRGLRDAAIVAVMVGCGLRRAELVALQYSDIVFRERSLRIIGKGNKERIAYLPDFAWTLIEQWIEQVRGDYQGSLFTRIRVGDDVTDQGLSVSGLVKILESRRQDALWVEAFSPHDLRRTFASQLLDQNVDLNTVRDLMGHSSITTTQNYDHRSRKRIEKAGRKINY